MKTKEKSEKDFRELVFKELYTLNNRIEKVEVKVKELNSTLKTISKHSKIGGVKNG